MILKDSILKASEHVLQNTKATNVIGKPNQAWKLVTKHDQTADRMCTNVGAAGQHIGTTSYQSST